MGDPIPRGFAQGHSEDRFSTTLWSVLSALHDPGSPQAQDALTVLCEKYWYPVYAFIRYRGHSPHEAQDLTQGFFVHLMDRDRLQRVQRERGRFRSFLMAAVTNYLNDQRDKAQAVKRGGGRQIVSLDEVMAERRLGKEPLVAASPGVEFDRGWAVALIDVVMGQLREENVRKGKEACFAVVQPLLIDSQGAPVSELAAGLGMSEGALRVETARMRKRFREILRAEIAETVSSEQDLEDELRHLMTIWAEGR